MTSTTDWHEHRDELQPGMVFKTINDDVVQLDRRVPGDGSKWYVANWWDGWAWMDSCIEPSDLSERLPDNYGEK
jgi:hypothetical protein